MDAINLYFNSYDQEAAKEDLSAKKPPPPIYTAPINITAIVKASALDTLLYGIPLAAFYSIITFCMTKISGRVHLSPLSKHSWKVMLALTPVFAYRLIQVIVGAIVHPAATPLIRKAYIGENFEVMRQRVTPHHLSSYQAMRISALSSTRHLVDGVLFKNKAVNLKGRYMIVTPPNAAFYEQLMDPHNKRIIDLASRLNAHILFFNYPGAGRSSGYFPNRDAMVASHQAMLSLLEEIGATQIVDFGWSIGGGVKWRDYLETPRLRGKYYSVDYQTFRSTSNFGIEALGKRGGQAVEFLQWEYNSEKALQELNHPHTVVQAGSDEMITGDGVITKGNALAQAADKRNVVLSPEKHCAPLSHDAITAIAERVEEYFKGE